MTGTFIANLAAADLQRRRMDMMPHRARIMSRPNETIPEMTENESYQQHVLDWELHNR